MLVFNFNSTLTFYWAAPFLLVVSVYGWLSLPCILKILFFFFCFLVLTYYLLMSYLSAGFFSGFYRSFKVTIIFLRRIVGPSVISNGPSVLRIQSSLMSEYKSIYKSNRTILRKIKITHVYFTYFKDLYIFLKVVAEPSSSL